MYGDTSPNISTTPPPPLPPSTSTPPSPRIPSSLHRSREEASSARDSTLSIQQIPSQQLHPPEQVLSGPTSNPCSSTSPHNHQEPAKLLPEDPDNYFIRSTYAELESTGVQGDGYEEGIERTRARLAQCKDSTLRPTPIRDISDAEVKVLSSVDRYGFYEISPSERQILLPKSAHLSPYKHASSSIDPSPPQLPVPPRATTSRRERSRIDKWERMILPVRRNENLWTFNKLKEHKLRERVYKGIPDRWRRAVWDLLILSFRGTVQHGKYADLLNEPSEFDIQIDLDVPRTISGHVMFKTRYGFGQRSLFHVLHCFSLHCGECGYCQGMGPIAATFLCYVEAEKAHEWMCYLHTAYSMHAVFRPGFPGLLENIYVQESLMKSLIPGVFEAFRYHNISTTSYATKWYITLFANTIPFQTQLRLWDAFLLEGPDVIVAMALYVVWAMKEHLLSKSASFETILSLLSSYFVPESDDHLLFWISKVMSDEDVRQEMQDSRNRWHVLVERGEEGKALL